MGASSECGAGRHRSCPGYYRVAHPCGCGCHRPEDHPGKELAGLPDALDHEHGQVECRPCNSGHRRNP